MSLRRALNVVYAMLVEKREGDPDALAILQRRLTAKFDYEMTPEERRWEELRRNAEDTGAIQGQQALLGLMGKQGLVMTPKKAS